MKEIIKNNIGLVGWIIASIMIFAGYYYDKNETLIVIGGFLWISSMSLQYELNKEKPKNWFITLITVTFFVAVFFILFN
jgi:hypothetical protein